MLSKLRNLMLEQHTLLLERERQVYESVNGPISGPGQFLPLVLGDAQFVWLRQISGLIVEIDQALSRRSTADQTEADNLTARVRDLMRPRENGTDFQSRYYHAVQDSSDVLIVQCRIEQLRAE